MDLTYNEGLWGRNAIYKRKENTQEMYSGTEITTINRRQKIYISFYLLKVNCIKVNFLEKYRTLDQEMYQSREYKHKWKEPGFESEKKSRFES